MAIRHAFINTKSFKESLEQTLIGDGMKDKRVTDEARELVSADIHQNSSAIEERLNTVMSYVVALWEVVSLSLACRPYAAEKLLESLGEDRTDDMSFPLNANASEFYPLTGEWENLPTDIRFSSEVRHIGKSLTKSPQLRSEDCCLEEPERKQTRETCMEDSVKTSSDIEDAEERDGKEALACDAKVGVRRVWKGRQCKPGGSDVTEKTIHHNQDTSDHKGSQVRIPFYDVNTGHKKTYSFYDGKPIGSLLQLYCDEQKLARNHTSFQIWEEEVGDLQTWAQLKKKHKDVQLSIDVEQILTR